MAKFRLGNTILISALNWERAVGNFPERDFKGIMLIDLAAKWLFLVLYPEKPDQRRWEKSGKIPACTPYRRENRIRPVEAEPIL